MGGNCDRKEGGAVEAREREKQTEEKEGEEHSDLCIHTLASERKGTVEKEIARAQGGKGRVSTGTRVQGIQ